MPEFITVEEAIFQLVEVLENTAPEDRPPFMDVVAAIAWGYGPGEVTVWPPPVGPDELSRVLRQMTAGA